MKKSKVHFYESPYWLPWNTSRGLNILQAKRPVADNTGAIIVLQRV